jgi:hypothetical protein
MKIFKSHSIGPAMALVICLSSSCLKQTESISPIAPVRTLAELQHESMMNTALKAAGNSELSTAAQATVDQNTADPSLFYLNIKYNIVNMDVYETAHIPNAFEQIGNSFLKAMAALFLKLAGSRTVNIGTIAVPVPDLNLDFSIIKSIRVSRVYLEYNKELQASTGNIADFSFINSLTIAKNDGSPFLSYTKANNKCQNKCLDFRIAEGNVLSLIKDVQSVKVKPTLSISSFPNIDELKLDGQIELQIGLKLPF